MSAGRDISSVVRSWIREEEYESADNVLQAVLSQLDSTPQRRSWWPAWRSRRMNFYTKALAGAAAVLVVVVLGYQLLPGRTSISGGPSPTPISTTLPSPSSPATARPTAKPDLVPPEGPLPPGRYPMNIEGIPMTFEIATNGWSSNGDFGFEKPPFSDPVGAAFIVWEDDADGIFSDPCAETRAPAVGPAALELAEAIASVPGVEVVTAPREISVDGRPGVEVAIRIPDELPCPPDQYYLWYDETIAGNARYATDYGMTIRVWIIEENGHRIQLDGETYAGAKAAIRNELDAIVRSIRFE
jgi:hypothetical protein